MMYVLQYEYLRWQMGYHIDSLDMCYGIQLADSRGDIGVIYAYELMYVFIIFSDRNFGVSL